MYIKTKGVTNKLGALIQSKGEKQENQNRTILKNSF